MPNIACVPVVRVVDAHPGLVVAEVVAPLGVPGGAVQQRASEHRHRVLILHLTGTQGVNTTLDWVQGRDKVCTNGW